MNQDSDSLGELDLAIADMVTQEQRVRASSILHDLPGVLAVRIQERGAWLSYRPTAISKEQICEALHRVGFRASTFQDSITGKTGSASF
jgi:hypothetical protein